MADGIEASVSEEASILEFLPEAADLLREKVEPAALVTAAEVDEQSEVAEEAVADEADADEVAEEEKPAEGGEKVQKRIDKLTARAKGAEEKVAAAESRAKELEAEVAKLREVADRPVEVVQAPTADNPLSDVNSTEDLIARVATARQIKRWCIENPDGGTVQNAKGEEIEIDLAKARRMLADADEVLTLHAPTREKFLAERQRHEAVARETYPAMFENGSEMARAVGDLVKAWPEVVRFPDYRLVLGDYIAGFKARTAKKSEAEKPAVKMAAIAPPVPKVSAAKPKPRGASAGRVISSDGSLDSLTEYFSN